ncbi:hypothetical protein ABW21_db0202450 [Orbilia brochopaga]|nr:hypothetical protein ABW21_db0202450 [Drechslerella brochopaga]
MDSNDSSSKPEPSQISGGLTQLQGTIESSVDTITGSESWKVAGKQDQSAGAQEVQEAQEKARKEAREERLQGKIDRFVHLDPLQSYCKGKGLVHAST